VYAGKVVWSRKYSTRFWQKKKRIIGIWHM